MDLAHDTMILKFMNHVYSLDSNRFLIPRNRVRIVPRGSGRMERVSYVQEDLLRKYTKVPQYKYNLGFLGTDQGYGYGSDSSEMYGSWVWIGAMDRLWVQGIPPRQCSIPSQVAQINHRSGRKPGMPPLSAHIQIIFRYLLQVSESVSKRH